MSIYMPSGPAATLFPSVDIRHRLARAKAKRRWLGIERHHLSGRFALIYGPLGEPVTGYEATTLRTIEHAVETIPVPKRKRRKTVRSRGSLWNQVRAQLRPESRAE